MPPQNYQAPPQPYQQQPNQYQPPRQQPYHRQGPTAPGGAIASLIMGIFSLFLCGIFLAIPALIVGYSARRQIDDNPELYNGRGLATAGIVMGWLVTIVTVAVVVLAVVVGIAENI